METKPNPCRDNISERNGKHSGRPNGKQSRAHVLARFCRGAGDPVRDIVEDKAGNKMGDKMRGKTMREAKPGAATPQMGNKAGD